MPSPFSAATRTGTAASSSQLDRGSDAPSTAWAIQALLAAGGEPGAAAFAYLRRLQRPDGSVRYSVRYDSSRLWTTAQVTPALARRPFPLR